MEININIIDMNTSPNAMEGEGDRNQGFSEKEKLVEDLEEQMRSVCSELFDMESKFDCMELAHEELQDKYEDGQFDIVMKDEQIAALQQTLQKERQHSLSVKELQNEVSQQKELLQEKDKEIRRWRKLAKNHRAALYKLDDTMSALDAAKSNCEALEKDLKEQLAHKNERHLQNLRRKEKAFQNELSNEMGKVRKQFTDREKHLTLQFSKKVASLEVELSEREKSFQMKLSEKEETFRIELSEKEKSFQEKFSERERSFQEKLSERETFFQIELSEKEKSFQEKLSEIEMSFHTGLNKREEVLKQKLSAREDSLQKEVSEIEETYMNKLSEREESLLKEVSVRMELSELCEDRQRTAQQLREENVQLQELLMAEAAKRKKRGFWSRLFKH